MFNNSGIASIMFNSIHPIPAFLDNYIWAITNQQNTELAVVDPGDPAPVIQYAEQHDLTLSHILITHHHKDHTGGLPELKRYSQPRVIGPCSSQIQGITEPVADADTF
ncbi:MAG: MBL fold metallo-hydrolase, partial [Gammaproteobacteria bacterium]|nr:MBL fold metallo-hydrolase [Gammaproteobacteria bacterium]